MAIISSPITFSSGEIITASDHNTNYGNIYTEFNGNIDNGNIKALAGIVDTKLAQITTAAKVSGTAITGLASLPSAAGAIPAVNLSALYPIGCIYTETTGTNPGTTFGFGTWVAFGAGRFLLGNGGGYSAGATGGSATVTLTSATVPSHTHEMLGSGRSGSTPGAGNFLQGAVSDTAYGTVQTGSSGTGGAHENMPPYIVVYFWNRTA